MVADRAPTCSWGAAGCRAGTCCRRWSRDGPRRRSRCSRRSRPAASSSASAIGNEESGRRSRRLAVRGGVRRQQRRSPGGAAPRAGLAPQSPSADSARAPRRPRPPSLGQPGEPALVVAGGEVEDLIADRDADPRRPPRRCRAVGRRRRAGSESGSRRGPGPTRPRSGARGRGSGSRRSRADPSDVEIVDRLGEGAGAERDDAGLAGAAERLERRAGVPAIRSPPPIEAERLGGALLQQALRRLRRPSPRARSAVARNRFRNPNIVPLALSGS